MAFPADLTLVTLTIQLDAPPDGGAPGYLDIRSPAPLIGPGSGSVVPPIARRVTLDTDGAGTVELPATNDPDWTPQGWAYTVTGRVGDGHLSGTITLDYQTSAVNLADVFVSDGTTTVGVSYIPLTSRGAAGGVAGLDADGDVIDADGSKIIPGGGATAADVTLDPSGYAVITSAATDVQAGFDQVDDALGSAAPQMTVVRSVVTSGNITPQSSPSAWAQLTGGPTIAINAAVGDYVELSIGGLMFQPNGSVLELAVLNSGLVRYGSTGGASPSLEGDPAFYLQPSTFRTVGATLDFVAEASDISNGQVTFCFATSGNGTGVLYASSDYPLRWRAINHGPVSVS
jgi:hypothetical protein